MSDEDENLLEYWDDLHRPGPRPPPVPGRHPGDLVIGTTKDRELVRIHPDGTLTYGPEYTPDEAAVEFWTQMSIRRLESEERVLHLGVMEQFLQRLGQADISYEAAALRSRRPEASEHDRFMEEISRRNLEAVVHQTIEFGRGLLARPNPPPPVETLIRPDYLRPPETRPFVHRRLTEGVSAPWYCVCGAPWSEIDNMCSTELVARSGVLPPMDDLGDPYMVHSVNPPEPPAHTFCSSGEASPWHHDHVPEPHCQCGSPWEDGRCSFVAAGG